MHEIESLVQQIKIVEDKLNNKDFLSKAPEKIVNLEKQKIVDFKKRLNQELIILKSTILSRLSEDEIIWFIQEIREYELNWQFDGWGKKEKSNILIYSQEWFDYVYNPIINPIEILNLSNYCKENKLSIVFSHNQYYSENIANFDHLPKLLPERSFDIYLCKSLITGDNIFYSNLPDEEILAKKNIHYCCKLERNKEYPNWFIDKVSNILSKLDISQSPRFHFHYIDHWIHDVYIINNEPYYKISNDKSYKLSESFINWLQYYGKTRSFGLKYKNWSNKSKGNFSYYWIDNKLQSIIKSKLHITWNNSQKRIIEIIFRNMLQKEKVIIPEDLLSIYIQTQFKLVDNKINLQKEQQLKEIPF